MKRQRINFGDYFYVKSAEDGTFFIETTRGNSARVEKKIVESGFKTKALARERALAFVSSPRARQMKFKLIRGDKG